jgi:hypothetical protein
MNPHCVTIFFMYKPLHSQVRELAIGCADEPVQLIERGHQSQHSTVQRGVDVSSPFRGRLGSVEGGLASK